MRARSLIAYFLLVATSFAASALAAEPSSPPSDGGMAGVLQRFTDEKLIAGAVVLVATKWCMHPVRTILDRRNSPCRD
jgi:hypothetical protein